MASPVTISNTLQIEKYEANIKTNITKTIASVRSLIDTNESDVMNSIAAFKFDKIAFDPISGEPDNLIEVINQCHTYLLSLKAARQLLVKHPNNSFILNWGNTSGYDIESDDRKIIAECFAATSFRSNQKLAKDLKRLSENKNAEFKYEFFYDKEFEEKLLHYYEDKYPGIQIVKIDIISTL